MSKALVIAIDGPAGAGKSTVSKILAAKLSLSYLDTGAMYRAFALKAGKENVDRHDGEALARLLGTTEIAFGQGNPPPVFLDGEEVTTAIRTPEVGELASALSAHPPVRRAMVERQRVLVGRGGVILEGRDATTVIAPGADLKIYLTASLEERARRRHVEFVDKGIESPFEQVRTDIEQRDHRDITREDSPLAVAPDAHVVETALLTIDQVVDRILALLPR